MAMNASERASTFGPQYRLRGYAATAETTQAESQATGGEGADRE